MAEKNRKCAVCRQEYKYCPRCNDDKDKPTWYFTFCSSNCKDIYEVTSKFENGQLAVDKAKKELDKLDISKLDNFGESYRTSIAKINEVKEEVNIEQVVFENEEVTTTEENLEDNKEIKKPRKAKKDVE